MKTSKEPIRRVPEGPGVHLVVVCMGLHGFFLYDNEKLVIIKTKSILIFCFSKTFLGTTLGPIGRVPEGPGVHLVVVCMGLHELFLYQ